MQKHIYPYYSDFYLHCNNLKSGRINQFRRDQQELSAGVQRLDYSINLQHTDTNTDIFILADSRYFC